MPAGGWTSTLGRAAAADQLLPLWMSTVIDENRDAAACRPNQPTVVAVSAEHAKYSEDRRQRAARHG